MPNSRTIEVTTLEKRIYPHPEAPEYATIPLISEGSSFEVYETEEDFDVLYLEYRARKAGNEIVQRRISK